MADYIENPPVMSIKGGFDPKRNVIRIDASIRLRWVCAKDHDHRFRFTAWLCNLDGGFEVKRIAKLLEILSAEPQCEKTGTDHHFIHGTCVECGSGIPKAYNQEG